MLIIQIDALEGNFHPFQSQSHRRECWLDGWIEVPKALEAAVHTCLGYCEPVIEDGVLVNIIPKDPPPMPPPEPTVEEILLELNADQEYRLCLIELGLL